MEPACEPLVSILLPFRDTAETLESCLHSIRRQTFTDWECLLVDDRSTDRSPAIAWEAASGDRRFRLEQAGREGLVPALNHGLARCRGSLIARMDGDDLMHRERLSRQVGCLGDQEALAAVGCRVRMFPRRTLGKGMRTYETWLNRIDGPGRILKEMWVECPVAHPGLMARSAILRQAGYRDRGWPEDYDLVLRLLGDGHRIGVAPGRLLLWRRHPGSLAMTDPRYGPDRFIACKAEHLCRRSAVGFLAGESRYLLWGYGRTGRTLARELARRGRRPAAIVEVHEGRIGNTIQGAPVIRPEDLPAPGYLPLVVSVAGHGPRERIRDALVRRGWRESRDFICAA